MKVRLAVVMSEDESYFIAGNAFEDDKEILSREVLQLGLTGRCPTKQYFIELELPEMVIAKDELQAKKSK